MTDCATIFSFRLRTETNHCLENDEPKGQKIANAIKEIVRPYHMRFYHAEKTYRETTGTDNKKEAESVMRKRIKEVRGGGNARQHSSACYLIERMPAAE